MLPIKSYDMAPVPVNMKDLNFLCNVWFHLGFKHLRHHTFNPFVHLNRTCVLMRCKVIDMDNSREAVKLKFPCHFLKSSI